MYILRTILLKLIHGPRASFASVNRGIRRHEGNVPIPKVILESDRYKK